MGAQYSTPNDEEFTTLGIFAARVGVTLAAVTNWRSRHGKDFPLPVPRDEDVGDLDSVELQRARSKGRLYRTDELVDWARRHGRLASRPVDASLSPLNAIAAALGGRPGASEGFMRSSAAEELREQASRALALAALRILEVARPDLDPNKVDELAPALHIQEERGRSDAVDASLAGALDELEQQTRTDLLGTIENVRSDFRILSERGRSADLEELAAVAAAGAHGVRRIIDPCCGTGDLLALLAQEVGPTAELVGRDLDPLRLAAAAAFLMSLGCSFVGTVGEPDDADWLASVTSDDVPSLVVTQPRSRSKDGPLSPAPRPSEWWLQLLGQQLAGPGDLAVVPVSRLWLEGRRFGPVAAHVELLDSERRVVIVDTPATHAEGSALVLLDRSTGRDALLASWDADASDDVTEQLRALLALPPTAPLPPYAEAVTTATLQERGSLLPSASRPLAATFAAQIDPAAAAPAAPRRPRRVQHEFQPAPTRGRPRNDRSVDQRLPAVPLAALQSLRESIDAEANLAPRSQPVGPATARFGDRTDLVQVLRGADLPSESRSRFVVLTTTPARFGQVRIVHGTELDPQEHRRGVHVFALSGAARQRGISEEFLAAWLSSARVQGALRASVPDGADRLTASAADVENLPADFPDPDSCREVAARWKDVERVEEFAQRLPASLTTWKLNLLSDVLRDTPED